MYNEHGVFSAGIRNPLEIVSDVDNVKFLSLDVVKEIIVSELGTNPMNYTNNPSKMFFNLLEFGYCCVKDINNDGRYSFVPVWSLSSGITKEL